jgi:TonB family protein
LATQTSHREAKLHLRSFSCQLTVSLAEDKGRCPTTPPSAAVDSAKKLAQATATTNSDGERVGTVTVLTVVSDTGYVCSAKVIQGLAKKVDDEAVDTVRKWRFRPAIKNGARVPVVVNIQLTYRIDKNGNVITESPKPEQIQPHQ